MRFREKPKVEISCFASQKAVALMIAFVRRAALRVIANIWGTRENTRGASLKKY